MEGQTLILPAHKLSARDKEILAGIGPWSYRTYPVRAGETLDVSPGQLAVPTAPSRLNSARAASCSRTASTAVWSIPLWSLRTDVVKQWELHRQQAIPNLDAASKGSFLRHNVQDIISKRNITRLEMEGINPSVDLDNLEPNQVRAAASSAAAREQSWSRGSSANAVVKLVQLCWFVKTCPGHGVTASLQLALEHGSQCDHDYDDSTRARGRSSSCPPTSSPSGRRRC